MKIYKTFRKLTQFTYVYGDEHMVLPMLPEGLQEDEVGNYFMEIGDSETMFCAHLDTAAWDIQRVRHVQFISRNKQDFITTDGTTILGADDKAGVVILMNLIEKKVPGLYYFFIGEESGLIGSKGILDLDEEKFKKYKRCIAFDRRDYGSIISAQMGGKCCSNDFVKALASQFAEHNMTFRDDPTGVYTDSAVFMDIIPEVTNLSVGYFNEHTTNEIQNLTYLSMLANAATKIDWESLPTVRDPLPKDTPNPKRGPKRKGDLDDDDLFEIWFDVEDIIASTEYLDCTNYDNFMPEKDMIFVNYADDDKYVIVCIHENGSITIDKRNYNEEGLHTFEDVETLEDYYREKFYGRKWGGSYSSQHDDEFEPDNDEEGEGEVHDYHKYKDKLDKEHSEHVTMAENFEKGINMEEFMFDVNTYLYENNTNKISAKEMNNILDKYNRTIESYIYWLFARNNDPNKTYGIKWDLKDGVFISEES